MVNKAKKSVLFVCTGNSARSQMAEALLKHRAGEAFDVYSAGTCPETVDIRAIEALAQFGISTKNLASKSVSAYTGQSFDFVITLCDKANTECRDFPGALQQLAWDFPDPKTRDADYPFYQTLTELNSRLSMFLRVEGQAVQSKQSQADSQAITVDPIAFYKTFTDDIRLKTLMLTHYHGELCVCELMTALSEESQPKVSRNLAVLKKAQIIIDRKHGQWVFYRINPNLPLWAKTVIAQTTEHNISLIYSSLTRLASMQNRPEKDSFCK